MSFRYSSTSGEKSMRTRKFPILILAGLLAGLVALGTGCGRSSHSEPAGKAEGASVPVEVAMVTVGDIASYWTGTATLEAEKETEVVAKVGGVVKRLLVEEGDYVRAGQALAKLDDEKIAVQVEQAKANLDKLESDYERAQELFAGDLVSAQEFQRAKYEYESQKAAYSLCELDLEYTSICSPISGVVAERLVKVGNMVTPNSPVFKVTDPDPLLAVLHVPERQVGMLREGQRAIISVDALGESEFAGTVKRISPVIDPSTGTIKATIEVRDTSGSLKPGMFARVNIVSDVHQNAVLAPRDAVIEEDNKSVVFVVTDSTAYRRIVETGYVNSVHIEVVDGLALGDTVVTTGKTSVKDSSKVEMVNLSPPSEVAAGGAAQSEPDGAGETGPADEAAGGADTTGVIDDPAGP
jgi:membrane fusion protein (multidrug efflux system)